MYYKFGFKLGPDLEKRETHTGEEGSKRPHRDLSDTVKRYRHKKQFQEHSQQDFLFLGK